ncbi:MAG: FkbM family methyltransferase [Pseudomonadota bacterium]
MNLFDTKAKFQAGSITKAQYIDEMHAIHRYLFDYADFVGATDIATIEITANQVVMISRSSGCKIVCDRFNKRIAPLEILNFGAYEQTDSDMMFRLIRPGFEVLDVGANIGWYALKIANISGAAHVWAFEPVPETFAALQANIALNQLDNIVAYNLGFSDHVGEVMFYFPPGGADNASAANLSERSDAQSVRCQLTTLDDFVAGNSLHVDFIKCDVEGAELFVFKGAINTLRQCRPIIYTEMLRKWAAKFQYHPNEIIELLVGLGYRCFTAKADRLVEFYKMDEATVETNFFFLHATQHATEIGQWS